MTQGVGLGYLLGMSGVVAFGSVIPVIPTGAAVSVAAALARHDDPLLLLAGVVAFGAAGAYLGDVITYAALRIAGRQLLDRVAWLRRTASGDAFDRIRGEMVGHELRTLLVSRLIPGGRIPVLVVAALSGYPLRRFAVADVAAVLLWSLAYAGIGLVGRAVFPEPWQSAVAVVLLVVLVAVAGSAWQKRRQQPVSR